MRITKYMIDKLMFLCTGNSCRSQMAEGFVNTLGGEQVLSYSAGLSPHGLNPRAVKVMQEIGIDISTQRSDAIDLDLLKEMDLVITLCSHADTLCPSMPENVKKEHWPFDDPATATGTEEEILSVFRRVRDEIKEKIIVYLENHI